MMTLRPARDEDASPIAEIWHDGWWDAHGGRVSDDLVAARTRESFESRAPHRVGDAVVATVSDAVAGFVIVVDDEVEQIYVAREHRGTGVAAALLAETERLVKRNGHDRAWLAVVAGNSRARRFYERNGWSDEGLIDYPAATATGPILVPARRYAKQLTHARAARPLAG
jgi:GNAT superfamily N-acetyltransferase